MIGPSSFAGHNDSINTPGFVLYNIYKSWQTQITGKSGPMHFYAETLLFY